jgi:hypothetical protein
LVVGGQELVRQRLLHIGRRQIRSDRYDFAICLLQRFYFFGVEMERHLGRLRFGEQHVRQL